VNIFKIRKKLFAILNKKNQYESEGSGLGPRDHGTITSFVHAKIRE